MALRVCMRKCFKHSSCNANEIKCAWHIVNVNKDIHLLQNLFSDGISPSTMVKLNHIDTEVISHDEAFF